MLIRNDELFYYETVRERDPLLNQLIGRDTLYVKNRDNLLQHEGHLRQYADFTVAIQNGTSPRFDATDSWKTTRVLNAIEESSRKRCWIDLTD